MHVVASSLGYQRTRPEPWLRPTVHTQPSHSSHPYGQAALKQLEDQLSPKGPSVIPLRSSSQRCALSILLAPRFPWPAADAEEVVCCESVGGGFPHGRNTSL